MSNRVSILDVVVFAQHILGALDEIPDVEEGGVGFAACSFVPAGVGFEGTVCLLVGGLNWIGF